MMLFRPAQKKDLEAIHALAIESGASGITTLPKDKALIKARLHWASLSFKKACAKPEHEYYWFVLEDTEAKTVVGSSAIESATGFDSPFYSYKLSKRTRICQSLAIRSEYETLNLVNDYQNYSELCTLYLKPDYRKNHLGLLLSKARFLFMAEHPERFTEKIIAEMRGFADKNGRSPFWENLGKQFFHMSFTTADQLTLSTDKQFIADLMPRNPIYVNLLPEEAQAVIGQAHVSTVPAMHILMKEGFSYQGYVDIFDAGPSLEAPLKKIRTLAKSLLLRVSSFSDAVSGPSFLLSNTQLDFRATLSAIILNESTQEAIISKETAHFLKIKKGDGLRMACLHF